MAVADYTQDQINSFYAGERTKAGNTTTANETLYNQGVAMGFTPQQMSLAGAAYKAPPDPVRADGVYQAFNTTMNNGGIINAANPNFVADSNTLYAQGAANGVTLPEFSAAMDKWSTRANTPYTFGSGDKTKTANGNQINDAWGSAVGATQGGAVGEVAVAKNMLGQAADSGATTTQWLAMAQGINPNLTADQMMTFIDQSGYMADAQGRIVRKPVTGATTTTASTTGTGATTTTTPVLTPTGIISSMAAPAVSTYTAAGHTPVYEQETIEGRMARLLDPNNPYNQAVITSARQQANGRGMLNSSMGDSMAQDAMLKNAIQIAGPDAATYSNAAQFTANSQNEAGRFNAGAQNAMGLQTQAQGYDSSKTDKLQGFNVANMNQAAQIELNKLSATQANYVLNAATAQGYNLQTLNANQINELATLARKQEYNAANVSQAAQIELNKLSTQQANLITNAAIAQGYALETLTKTQVHDLAKQTLANQGSLAAAGISASASAASTNASLLNNQNTIEANRLSQASTAVTSLMNNNTSFIASIDKTLSGPAQQELIDRYNLQTRTGLQMIGALAGDVDLSAYMDMLFPV